MADIDLTFTIPPDVTFEQAIALSQDLLAAQPSDDVLTAAITALVATPNGARGFLVTFLSGEFALADRPTESVAQGLRTNPELIADLMAKNLAMSTAMELTHRRNGNLEMAAGSQQTQQRSRQLIQLLNLQRLNDRLRSIQQTVIQGAGDDTDFLARWGYDDEQKAAIVAAIEPLISP
ncbi:hypothetical protein ACN4EG_01125 [Alkalinema pantanalense CENA528]|uniref:hypothetical protein n=1 Tax=Alkalinema pantanalense TaxID=1620705 RepID=UPI003D6F2C27